MAKFDIDTIRHSTAHLMAQAIERLYPDQSPQFGVGPVIDNGFYYDMEMEYRLSEEDLQKIEEEMKRIIKENLSITKKVMDKKKAVSFFKKKKQQLKVELIENFPDEEEISSYTQGEFTDLCRGPHVESTGQLPPFFKLLNVAGAYWLGDEKRQMLQRIYAACFTDKKQLKKHLDFLQEVKKRDHRVLGRELHLFQLNPLAPGMPFFTPKGTLVYNELMEFMRRIYRYYDFKEVITPQILSSELWHTSGHYQHYRENMYFTKIDEREYAIKPMNCPCHMIMFKSGKHSYRDLPLRLADFGRIHRYEKSGALAGITRVRSFCQDDAHIFLPEDAIREEIKKLLDSYFICYRHFGMNKIKVQLSTRPQDKAGDDKQWDRAEEALEAALKEEKTDYGVNKGDGAFYGPKIDIEVSDAIGRSHQLGTIQLDFQLPERFDLKFVNKAGNLERPIVIHKALLGSLERFFGIYLEHVAGGYPFWLAPEQATIVPVNEKLHQSYAEKIHRELWRENFRVSIDNRNEGLGFKTRQIQKAKIPFMLVVGDKEQKSGTVSIRAYGEKKSQSLSLSDLKSMFLELARENIPKALRDL
ncbi:MAG: threonine--tRNA ligase [Halobacteriovoraceae bacterium]|nr:threonine--tRNA ligase [Halobacteriovoraceae bacterium]